MGITARGIFSFDSQCFDADRDAMMCLAGTQSCMNVADGAGSCSCVLWFDWAI